MKQVLYSVVMILLMTGCKTDEKDNKASDKTTGRVDHTSSKPPLRIVKEEGVAVPIYDFKDFKPFLHQKNDTIYVINFWATWCKPCVKELPGFEKINQHYKDAKVKVLLVNMDFPDKIKSQLIPFIRKMDLQSKIVMLDEPDANAWIPEVDPDWSGAVPATLIYKNGKRTFYSKPLTYKEVKNEIDKFIINKK